VKVFIWSVSRLPAEVKPLDRISERESTMTYSERWITQIIFKTLAARWLTNLQSLSLLFFLIAAIGVAVCYGEGQAKHPIQLIFLRYCYGGFIGFFACGFLRTVLMRWRFAPPWSRGAESGPGATGRSRSMGVGQ
jgi:hypothetical protein